MALIMKIRTFPQFDDFCSCFSCAQRFEFTPSSITFGAGGNFEAASNKTKSRPIPLYGSLHSVCPHFLQIKT